MKRIRVDPELVGRVVGMIIFSLEMYLLYFLFLQDIELERLYDTISGQTTLGVYLIIAALFAWLMRELATLFAAKIQLDEAEFTRFWKWRQLTEEERRLRDGKD